jgi:hypothetical protein
MTKHMKHIGKHMCSNVQKHIGKHMKHISTCAIVAKATIRSTSAHHISLSLGRCV